MSKVDEFTQFWSEYHNPPNNYLQNCLETRISEYTECIWFEYPRPFTYTSQEQE